MSSYNCCCKRDCTLIAVVISAVLGVVAAFLQISGTITVAPVFLWAAAGVAVVYLAVLVASARRGEQRSCLCPALKAVLLGILGTVLFSLVLLAVGIVATSTLSAVLVGLVVAALSLILTASACLVKCLAGCED